MSRPLVLVSVLDLEFKFGFIKAFQLYPNPESRVH